LPTFERELHEEGHSFRHLPLEHQPHPADVKFIALLVAETVAQRIVEEAIRGRHIVLVLDVPGDADPLVPARIAGHLQFRRLFEHAAFFLGLETDPVFLRDHAFLKQQAFE
jgi:hypothetical protein